jgi:protein-S-isoprenylcysteine O-methyltransferase Ste14
MSIPSLIILGCWIVFIVYWWVSALKQKATAERMSFLSSLAYRIPICAGVILVARYHWPQPLNLPLTPYTPVSPAIGAALCVAGLILTIWSRWTLAGNWSSEVTFKQGHQLVNTGPYRFVRHPIYSGIILMLLASVVQYGRLHCWLGWVIFCMGFWIKLRQEETIMQRHFPEYSSYRAKVKALVPFIL